MPAPAGSNIGHLRFIVKLYSLNDKQKEKAVTLSLNEKMRSIPGIVTYTVAARRGGPPRSKPISVQIFGRDFDALEKISEEILAYVGSISNTTSVVSSTERGKKEFLVNINEYAAATLGVNARAIAGTVRNAFEGGIATIAKGFENLNDEIDVVVKYPTNKTTSKHQLEQLAIKNNRGQNIKLNRFASIKENSSINRISREERQRYISVTGELVNPRDRNFNAAKINQMLKGKVKELNERYPNNRIKIGGEQEDTVEQNQSSLVAMILALVGVFVILTGMLRSYIQPLVIMTAIPFAFVGVVLGLLIHRDAHRTYAYLRHGGANWSGG